MKIREIQVSFSFTKNLGNYQSLRAEAGLVAELEPEERVEAAFIEAFETVKAEVRKQARGTSVVGNEEGFRNG